MGANEKLLARRRAREAQCKKIVERVRRDRANAVDAEAIRAILHRVNTVDTWERRRLDQAAELIRADAVKKRAGHFRGLQSRVDRMRARAQTLPQIAELAGVDARAIQIALQRARTGDVGRRDAKTASGATSGPTRVGTLAAGSATVDPLSDLQDRPPSNARGGAYDPTRCVRCEAVMLDEDAMPRRGRRRLYCSDTCRRDASAARTAAERYGAPIRVVEVPKVVAPREQPTESAVTETAGSITPMVASHITLGNAEALRDLLGRVTEQARLKKLDRATLTAARELSKAVHPHRAW